MSDLQGLGGVREVDASGDCQDLARADLAAAVPAVVVAGSVRDRLPGWPPTPVLVFLDAAGSVLLIVAPAALAWAAPPNTISSRGPLTRRSSRTVWESPRCQRSPSS